MAEVLEFLKGLGDCFPAVVAIRLVAAMILGGIVGLERSKHGRSAGMRTHILVCIGSALAALIGVYGNTIGFSGDPLRIAAQVISGIGFLGAGLILIQNKSKIVGLTTAAGLWNTAVIGLACGIGFYEGALLCEFMAFLTALVLPRIEMWFSKNDKHSMLYVELEESSFVNGFYDKVRDSNFGELHRLDITSPRSDTGDHVGVVITITLPKHKDIREFEKELRVLSGVVLAVEL